MRIVGFPVSIAVLFSTAVFFLTVTATKSSYTPLSSQSEFFYSTHPKESNSSDDKYLEEDSNTNLYPNQTTFRPWLNVRQVEKLLLLEGGEQMLPVACCPSVTELTAPDGGKNSEGKYVQLYQDGEKRQQFYETSCLGEVLDQPCRFMERKLHNRSRCVQKYSFSYAIVMQNDETTDSNPSKYQQTSQFSPLFGLNQTQRYVLDHVQIRSGCSCEILPSRRQKKKSNPKEKKQKLSGVRHS